MRKFFLGLGGIAVALVPTIVFAQTAFSFFVFIGYTLGPTSVEQGKTLERDLKIISVGTPGESRQLTYSASGAPSGVDISFSPATCLARPLGEGSSCDGTIIISANNSSPTGKFPITIFIQSGDGVQRTTRFTLTVTPPGSNGFFIFAPYVLGFQPLLLGGTITRELHVIAVGSPGTFRNLSYSASSIPGGVSYNFSPQTCTARPMNEGDPCSAVLSLNAGSSAVPGRYPVIITVRDQFGKERDVRFYVQIQDPTTSGTILSSSTFFSLYSSGSRTITPGGSLTRTIQIFFVGFLNDSADLIFSVSGLPNGVTASFSPSSCLVRPAGQGTPCNPTLTLTAAESAPAGSYPITVTATSAEGETKSTTFSITVANTQTQDGTPPPPPSEGPPTI